MTVLRLPLLNAWWMEARCRMGLHARTLAMVIPAALALLIYLPLRFAPLLRDAVTAHPVILDVLVAVESSVLAQLARRRWEVAYAGNWVSSLPVSGRQRQAAIALRATIYPASILMVLVVVALLVRAPIALLAALPIATVAGTLLGWCLPQAADEHSASTLATVGQWPQKPLLISPTLTALSGWSAAQARLWLRPRSMARVLAPVMLSLPMGTSGNLAVALMTVLMLMVYLCVSLIAMRKVMRDSDGWLRPTPVTVLRLARALWTRPLLQQLQWTLLASTLIVAMGAPAPFAVRLAQWWLAMVTLTSSIQLAQLRAGRPVVSRLIVSLGALLLLDRLKQHLLLPCALLISAWHLKKGIHER